MSWRRRETPRIIFIYRRSQALQSLCFLFTAVMSSLCFHIIFSYVWVAEWPPFGKLLLNRMTICSLCDLTICNFSYFPFWFWGWIWVLIASVPGLCILLTFKHCFILFYLISEYSFFFLNLSFRFIHFMYLQT